MIKIPQLFGVTAAALLLTACFFDEYDADLEGLQPYKTDGAYADVIVDCVRAESPRDSCKLSTLPAIGMITPDPTIDDIMDRVVVSHEWMGDNFEALLDELPDDLIYLMQGVTAVVIGKDIRPSYYWNLTGAIYLDPNSLWLTEEQRLVISTEPDYREAYSDPMSFRSFWRWSKDSGRAWPYSGQNANGVRPLSDIVYSMASLLFHELAHANDLLPQSAYDDVSMDDSIFSASNKLSAQYPSSRLKRDDPLQSQQMTHLATILYRGFTPSDEDKAVTASEVGTFFEPDIASDDYAYTTQYEDLAMLFEEAMMKLHFDIDRDMAFVIPTTPEGQDARCDDYIVGWGVRNRVGDLNVLPRAEFVLNTLLPHRDFSTELSNFPLPTALPNGTGWCSSVQLQRMFEKSVNAIVAEPQPLSPEYYTRPYKLYE